MQNHSDMPPDQLLRKFEKEDPHIRVGTQFVHILYGPKTMFLDGDGVLKADIRGLVYKRNARSFAT